VMKTITAYKSEFDGKIFEREDQCIRHDEVCKWTKEGHAIWYERGTLCHAEKVPLTLFSEHKYADHDGTSDCSYGCGCWMGPSASGGPVDPFGPCPRNPR
jgi:hypothetical protein